MRLIILFLLGMIPSVFFAQVVVDSPEYHQMKLSGQLGSAGTVLPNPALAGGGFPVISGPSGNEKANSCDCYKEPDASYILAIEPNDDGSSVLIPIPFNFCLYGQTFNQIYINNNGNITFTNDMSTFSATAFPSSANGAIVAPFWGDVDTRPSAGSTVPNGEVLYKITNTAVYVNYKDVGYFPLMGDMRNTFQLIITDGVDPIIEGGNVAFCYKDMQWTTGSASGGTGGFAGTPATAGANKGDGASYFLISRFDHPGNDFAGALDTNGISWLDYKSFAFDACNAGNVPPIPDGVSSCDTFRVCSYGDTADISINFLSPETTQSTSISWTNGGLTSLQQMANNSGNTAQLVLRVIGDLSTAGDYNITVTATDNAVPIAGVTTLSFVIQIDNSGIVAFNPVLAPPLEGCDTVALSVLNGPYDTYLWDDLTQGPLSGVGTAQDYGVTVSLNGCYKRIHEFINVIEPTPFNFVGPFTYCPPDTTVTLTIPDSVAFSTIDWNIGVAAQDSMYTNTLPAGTYHVEAMDSAGACPSDTTFTISLQLPLVLEPDDTICSASYTFTGNTGGTNTGTWLVLGTPAVPPVFANNHLNTTVNFGAFGTYSLVFEESNCLDRDTITLYYTGKPSNQFTGSLFYCPGTSGSELFFPDSANVGSITWQLTDPAHDSLFINTLTAGNYTITLTDTLGFCQSDTSITISSQPPLVLENDLVTCVPSHTFLTNTGGSGTGVWTVLSPSPGTVFFGNANNLNTTASFPVFGDYFLVYTEAGCGDDDTVKVTYGATPHFDFDADFFVCPGDLESLLIADSANLSSVTWGLSNPSQDTLYSVNLAPGTYHVQVESNFGCPADTTFTISTQPGVMIDNITQICGDTVEFTNNTGVQIGQWSSYSSPGTVNFRDDNALNTGLDVSEYGLYHLVFSESTCNDADTVHINFVPYPYVDLNESIEFCFGQSVEIVANVGYPAFTDDLMWSTGSIANSITTGIAGEYFVTVENVCGSHTDSILLISKICDFDLPNVFTPNGEGDNNTWKLINAEDIFTEFTCVILNRWGNVVFEFDGPTDEWDGKDAQGNDVSEGVYFYNIEFTTLANESFVKHGFLHLER